MRPARHDPRSLHFTAAASSSGGSRDPSLWKAVQYVGAMPHHDQDESSDTRCLPRGYAQGAIAGGGALPRVRARGF
ncbi:MAG: hypothetical protein ACPIOQ_77995 [Promethearchaeia archaeon]